MERILGYSLYFGLNFIPMLVSVGLPLGLVLGSPPLWNLSIALLMYVVVLFLCYKVLVRLQSWHTGQWAQYAGDPRHARQNQYSIGERNSQIYHNMRFVWPSSLHPVGNEHKPGLPTIFCVVPHGVLPVGAIAYPIFSKLFSPRICRWTAAPVLFSIPIIRDIVRAIGSIPAKGSDITAALAEGSSDIGIILDGIAGKCPSYQIWRGSGTRPNL